MLARTFSIISRKIKESTHCSTIRFRRTFETACRRATTLNEIGRNYCSTLTKKELLNVDSRLVGRYVQYLTTLYKSSKTELSDHLGEYNPSQVDQLCFKLDSLCKKSEDVIQLETMFQESSQDDEMKNLIQGEVQSLKSGISEIKNEILEELLCPEQVLCSSDVVFEVSAGVGGQEAMLFTKEIFDMYSNYFTYKGWTSSVVVDRTELGGLRYASAVVSGVDVSNHLRFEGGVHRVQRVPKTEKGGRLHTSTMAVAVLLQPSEVEVSLNPKDLKIETCRSSGKGGQHVNTTDSAVRIVHLPSGISAECQTERSQIKNKELALKLLRSRIYEKQTNKIQHHMSTHRKMQVGSASRNEKIRTYNFKDDRITDHRIGENVYNINSFFEGNEQLDNMIKLIMKEFKNECLIDKMENFKIIE